jgi:hypothetical protein
MEVKVNTFSTSWRSLLSVQLRLFYLCKVFKSNGQEAARNCHSESRVEAGQDKTTSPCLHYTTCKTESFEGRMNEAATPQTVCLDVVPFCTEIHRHTANPESSCHCFPFVSSFAKRSRNSSVGIVTGYGLTNRVQLKAEARNVSRLHSVETGSGAHLASYKKGTGLFTRGKAAEASSWPLTSVHCRHQEWSSTRPHGVVLGSLIN